MHYVRNEFNNYLTTYMNLILIYDVPLTVLTELALLAVEVSAKTAVAILVCLKAASYSTLHLVQLLAYEISCTFSQSSVAERL